MVNWKSKRMEHMLILANGLVILVLINALSSWFFFRADLTDEKRYSIKEPTKNMLRSLDDDVYVEVFLDGELNAGFQRFQKAIRETLDEFSVYSNSRVHYRFTDPAAALSQKAQSEFMNTLASRGIQPVRVIDNQDGQRTEKIIFPGALISYGLSEQGVHLLKGNKASSQEEEINQSIEGIEFELASAIHKLTNSDLARVGLVKGHGEIEGLDAVGFRSALEETYLVEDVLLLETDLSGFDALVIAKPKQAFSESEKFRLDQYIMNSGSVLFLLDHLEANMDSASRESNLAFPYQLNLDDQLFRYGVRINMDLVQDRSSGAYPVVTGQSGTRPQIQLMDWEFFPLINRYADHPVTRNLDAVVMHFVGSIDTVKAPGIRKTPLMFSSQQARKVSAPVNVSIQSLRQNTQPADFSDQFIPLAYLLEGSFTSLYRNRFLPSGESESGYRERGDPARLIVVADGDLARNVVIPRTNEPQPLGFDPFTNYTFANEDLLLNMLAYLTDGSGLILARNKEVRIRPLDKERIAGERTLWQVVNLGFPLLLLIALGLVRNTLRRKRYANF